MKNVYMAEVEITRRPYMEKSTTETVHTVVWAHDADEARQIVKDHYTVDDPYGCSQDAWVEITPALGSPD